MFNKKEEEPAEASVTELVDRILLDGYERRATDIHLEPYRNELRVRYRIDGMLHTVASTSLMNRCMEGIISRVKVLSGVNITEKRIPQDGRMTMRLGNDDVNLRVSVMPSMYGEALAIRLFTTGIYRLPELGLSPRDEKTLTQTIRKPYGIVFVTGPTGSGKTSTLYACLNILNRENVKTITIEDPIEYPLKGIVQVPVNVAAGLTFAQGLRSMLRHDPEVMMVGEVRDNETAEIAVRAALTGHLMLSTLHTNDAQGSITRLRNMGIESYLIASSLECVISQRLVAKICPHCKIIMKARDEDIAEFSGCGLSADTPAYAGTGCEKCDDTGYFGRTGIYEVMTFNDELRRMILSGEPASEIKKAAVRMGMRTIRDHGIEKVKAGVTTISELQRMTKDS